MQYTYCSNRSNWLQCPSSLPLLLYLRSLQALLSDPSIINFLKHFITAPATSVHDCNGHNIKILSESMFKHWYLGDQCVKLFLYLLYVCSSINRIWMGGSFTVHTIDQYGLLLLHTGKVVPCIFRKVWLFGLKGKVNDSIWVMHLRKTCQFWAAFYKYMAVCSCGLGSSMQCRIWQGKDMFEDLAFHNVQKGNSYIVVLLQQPKCQEGRQTEWLPDSPPHPTLLPLYQSNCWSRSFFPFMPSTLTLKQQPFRCSCEEVQN